MLAVSRRNKLDSTDLDVTHWWHAQWVELPATFTAMLGLQGPAVFVVWACGDRTLSLRYSSMSRVFACVTTTVHWLVCTQKGSMRATVGHLTTAVLALSTGRKHSGFNLTSSEWWASLQR